MSKRDEEIAKAIARADRQLSKRDEEIAMAFDWIDRGLAKARGGYGSTGGIVSRIARHINDCCHDNLPGWREVRRKCLKHEACAYGLCIAEDIIADSALPREWERWREEAPQAEPLSDQQMKLVSEQIELAQGLAESIAGGERYALYRA
jgi:hypothetical protein